MSSITQGQLYQIDKYYNTDEGVKEVLTDLYYSGEDKELVRLCEQLKWARIHLNTYLQSLVYDDVEE